MNDFDCAAKTKQPACKPLRVWTKNEENFESFQENFEIFWSKSLRKIEFFTFVTKYFLDFWLRSESIDVWKITLDLYNTFFRFRGGTFRRSSPPPPTDATISLTNYDSDKTSSNVSGNLLNTCKILLLHWLPPKIKEIWGLA